MSKGIPQTAQEAVVHRCPGVQSWLFLQHRFPGFSQVHVVPLAFMKGLHRFLLPSIFAFTKRGEKQKQCSTFTLQRAARGFAGPRRESGRRALPGTPRSISASAPELQPSARICLRFASVHCDLFLRYQKSLRALVRVLRLRKTGVIKRIWYDLVGLF